MKKLRECLDDLMSKADNYIGLPEEQEKETLDQRVEIEAQPKLSKPKGVSNGNI